MSDRDSPSINVSIPDPELRAFVREQAGDFFGGKIAPYIVSLIELDRREQITRNQMIRRLSSSLPEVTPMSVMP